ncbi:M23 family metallopeptidase [Nocardioides sp.]|uniref:M23 family metallopeptidase n=1 Tax=Nocardioides sp. TaxID=35761 RepID=UPI002D1FB07D|nr:M23 family metallopeptidase [Nocardioides sp.]
MGNHRADRRGSGRRPSVASSTQVTAGKRKAARHAGSRGPLFRTLPPAPVLAGVATLAVAVGGAVSSGGAADVLTTAASPATAPVHANALSGSSKVSQASLLVGRSAVVSRDSSRDTLADATDEKLVQQAEAQAKQRNVALAKFAKQAEAQSAKIVENAWVLPTVGYHLTATFGEYGLWSSMHTGLDFAAPPGTPIYAVAGGVVTSVGYDGAYGNKTVITLDDGTELWFCHQTSFLVSVGQEVRSGEQIGTVGSTGHTTGPHLHLEVRPGGGDPVDPYAALVAHGVTP